MKCHICHKFLSYTDDNEYNRKCKGHVYVKTVKNQIVHYMFVCPDTPCWVESFEGFTIMCQIIVEENHTWEKTMLSIKKHIPLTIKDELLQTNLVEDKLRKYLVFS